MPPRMLGGAEKNRTRSWSRRGGPLRSHEACALLATDKPYTHHSREERPSQAKSACARRGTACGTRRALSWPAGGVPACSGTAIRAPYQSDTRPWSGLDTPLNMSALLWCQCAADCPSSLERTTVETVRSGVKRVVEGRGLILTDIGVARLGGNFQPLALQNQIDSCDFILGLDRVVGNMIDGDHELGHGGPSYAQKGNRLSPLPYAGMMPGASLSPPRLPTALRCGVPVHRWEGGQGFRCQEVRR